MEFVSIGFGDGLSKVVFVFGVFEVRLVGGVEKVGLFFSFLVRLF